VSEFVEECRREWHRLGVPDPVANEMAADLMADLQEAEAEGGSPQDVLGNSAFDPRRFAAAWAVARGVTGPTIASRPSPWRPSAAIVVSIILGVLAFGAGLVLLIGSRSSSVALVAHRVISGSGGVQLIAPGPNRIVVPGPLGPFMGNQIAGVDFHPLALVLLIVGVVGLVVLAVLYWSRWSNCHHPSR
jgi:hypothetical protein